MPGCPPRAPLRLLPSQLRLQCGSPALRRGLVHMNGSMWKAFQFNLCRFRRVTAKEGKKKKKPLFQKRRLHKQKQQLPLLRGAVHLGDRSGHSLAAASPPAPLCMLPLLSIFPPLQDFTASDLAYSQLLTPQLLTDCNYMSVICCSSQQHGLLYLSNRAPEMSAWQSGTDASK